jgi:hypothetical protein
MKRITSVSLALMGAVAGTSSLTAVVATGCSSSITDTSVDSGSDTATTQERASAPDARSIPVDAARSHDAGTHETQTDAAIHEEAIGDDGASMDDASTDSTIPGCTLDGGGPNSCAALCTDGGVTCSVVGDPLSCEFEEFSEASAPVACGQTATVGTACCGACGCVAVEVFYDGARCWQGLPDCSQGAAAEFDGRWFDPHAP